MTQPGIDEVASNSVATGKVSPLPTDENHGDNDDDDNHNGPTVELKPMHIANFVSSPCGCISTCLIVLVFIGGCIGAIIPFHLKDPFCLAANFNDFRVRNSEIDDNWTRNQLLQTYSYSKLAAAASTSRRLFYDDGVPIENNNNVNNNNNNNNKILLKNIKSFLKNSNHYRKLLQTTWERSDYLKRLSTRIYFQVIFISKSSDLINDESLAECKKIEDTIKSRTGYHDRIVLGETTSYTYYELPPASFLNYIYPTESNNEWTFDGNGEQSCCDPKTKAKELLDISSADPNAPQVTFFDFEFSRNNIKSKWMVSIFPFTWKNGYSGSYDGGETTADLKKWVSDYYTVLDNVKGLNHVEFAYLDNGSLLTDEIFRYMYGDLYLALLSFGMIYVVVWVYTRSLFLTTFGLLGVLLAAAPSLMFYHIIFGGSFSIVNVVAIWVILGIGADDIFVFIASYRRAPLESLDGQLIPSNIRMAYAYREAGSAMFVTSFTTSISFFSLCLSKINPLPQFGFFIGAMVIFNFIFVLTYFPCLLQGYIWYIQSCMKCGCIKNSNNCQTKCISVPIRIKKKDEKIVTFDKSNRTKSFRVSHKAVISGSVAKLADLADSPLVDDNEGKLMVGRRQLSKRASSNFLVNANQPGLMKQNSKSPMDKARQLSRHISRKLDKDGKENKAVDIGFSEFTNLYFIVMRRGLGLCLVITVLALTGFFAYAITRVQPPSETTQILPSNTNFGIVQSALESLTIDTSQVSGYDYDVGYTPSANTLPVTPRPTFNPTKSTNSPTKKVTTPTTKQPSMNPSNPTLKPTKNPSNNPTIYPTIGSFLPTNAPTLLTVNPSQSPSNIPTVIPTNIPTTQTPSITPTKLTSNPSQIPSQTPIIEPTLTPSKQPTKQPSITPITGNPTLIPSKQPTNNPTRSPLTPLDPTLGPSLPTQFPTLLPSISPTKKPTNNPSVIPTIFPTNNPTLLPTTVSPTIIPTNIPTQLTNIPTLITDIPTLSTVIPTIITQQPSVIPTLNPTNLPTITPTLLTSLPTIVTNIPSLSTLEPTLITEQPTIYPTLFPTLTPTAQLPDNNSYVNCTNPETIYQELKINALIKCDILVSPGPLIGDSIAILIESPNTQISSLQCSSIVAPNKAYPSSINSSYNVAWCYVKPSSLTSVSQAFQINFTTPSTALDWMKVSLAIYTAPQKWIKLEHYWLKTIGEVTNVYNNFTYVTEQYSDFQYNELSKDVSLDVILLLGAGTVDGYSVNCDGEQTGGSIQFDTGFNFYDVTTQYRLLDLCTSLTTLQQDDPILYRRNDQNKCFMSTFNEYTTARGKPLPISNKTLMNIELDAFLVANNGGDFRSYIDFNAGDITSNGRVLSNATVVAFRQLCGTQISKNWGASKLWSNGYEPWQNWINSFNNKGVINLNIRQTSSGYVRMEVELEFLRGFATSVATTVSLCGIIMFGFTHNWYLVFLVCCYILSVVIWIVGLFGAMGWEFGVIEIISVPTVVGLTIDYALHITHAYIHAPYPDKLRRSKSAVDTLGGSVFASAMTTISAMIILYFAKIVIFSDLGWVVGATTTFGIFLALFVCPNVLMYTGPQRDQCSCGWCLFCIPNDKKPKCCKNNHWYDDEIAPASPDNKGDNNKLDFFNNDNDGNNDDGNELVISGSDINQDNLINDDNVKNGGNNEGDNRAVPGSTANGGGTTTTGEIPHATSTQIEMMDMGDDNNNDDNKKPDNNNDDFDIQSGFSANMFNENNENDNKLDNNNDNESDNEVINRTKTPAPPAPPQSPDEIIPIGPQAMLTPGGNNNNQKGLTPGGGNSNNNGYNTDGNLNETNNDLLINAPEGNDDDDDDDNVPDAPAPPVNINSDDDIDIQLEQSISIPNQ